MSSNNIVLADTEKAVSGMKEERKLIHSILLTVSIYALIEIGIFFFLHRMYSFTLRSIGLFLLAQIVFHGGIIILLIKLRSFFYIIETQHPLDHINVANKITLFRLSSLPLILFIILLSKEKPLGPVLIAALCITFITDLLDGRISRLFHQVTLMGKVLDSVGDYSLLIVIAISYVRFQLIKPWFFILLMFRLFFQALSMLILITKYKTFEPRPTILGKMTIASVMVLFVMEPLRLVPKAKFLIPFIDILEIGAALIVFISIGDKLYYFLSQAGLIKKNRA